MPPDSPEIRPPLPEREGDRPPFARRRFPRNPDKPVRIIEKWKNTSRWRCFSKVC